MKKIFICVSMILITSISTYAGINDGLVAYYPFESNANDESGNNFNGTVFGTPQFRDGKIGGSIKFDGAYGYVSLPSLPGSPEATISGWVQWHQFNSWSRFFDFGIEEYAILVANDGNTDELAYEVIAKLKKRLIFLPSE